MSASPVPASPFPAWDSFEFWSEFGVPVLGASSTVILGLASIFVAIKAQRLAHDAAKRADAAEAHAEVVELVSAISDWSSLYLSFAKINEGRSDADRRALEALQNRLHASTASGASLTASILERLFDAPVPVVSWDGLERFAEHLRAIVQDVCVSLARDPAHIQELFDGLDGRIERSAKLAGRDPRG